MSGSETFVRRSRVLERHVTPSRGRWPLPSAGRPYTHRCTLDVFERVSYEISVIGECGATIDMLHRQMHLPHSQVAVAFAFLKERGCVKVYRRRVHPASNVMYEDAMCEFHALGNQ